jgi:hypothetical protein
MKTLVSYWRELTIVILIGILLVVSQKNKIQTKIDTKEIVVKIPEVNGVFKTPVTQKELLSKEKDTVLYKDKVLIVESKINKDAVKRYLEAEDKLAAFTEEVRQRDYITDYSDENLDLSVTTSIQGKLISQIPKYKVKEKEIKLTETTITNTIEKKDNFGIILGAGFIQNNLTNTPNYELVTGVRIKKVTILGSVNTQKNTGLKILFEF